MANTIRVSKSTFSGGLVMDLAPDTTPNTVLTSALNATLVTFNGNEMQLQNDMGNGRVETARLPEGYIPVGTCEFGDIIYIVSYNPLTNKSQIGCFPSPERNISSEEVGSAGQTLKSSDFQEIIKDASGNEIPTGKLKTNSVKKIIYNNKLNPGDKFIIYDKNAAIYNEPNISDIGNTSHIYGSFPKWLKIHVVAIEDSGKINYLDSTLKWYKDYFIAASKKANDPNGADIPNIDSYRNLLSSGYSVFQSKISGKLALLIELEKITGFSCTHTIYSKNIVNTSSDIEVNKYLTYINFSWETENPNINPAAIILTDAEWVGEQDQQGTVKLWKKSTENNKLIELEKNGIKNYQSVSYINEGTQTNTTPSYPNGKYYEAVLDTLDQGDYETFINTNSYNAKLISKLKDINIVTQNGKVKETGYSKDALIKLNIKKENNNGYLMLPVEKQYYINALEKIKEKNGEHIEINFYSKSSSTGKMFKIEPYEIPDYIVNNYFHYPIYKRFLEFTIPTNQKIKIQEGEQDVNGNPIKPAIYIDKKPDITNMVYKYTVTPAMPYGLLDEYSITNYIDFSKIGTGSIELNTWKYFVGENALTLTLGLEAYVEDNMGISEIAIEFIDNQGVAAIYHITGKASYSGQFTEVIPLNGAASKSNLNSLNNYRNKWNYKEGVCVHCGQKLEEYQEGCVTFKKDTSGNSIPVIATFPESTTPPKNSTPSGNTTSPENTTTNTEEPTYYLNDAGIIYFGMLYLAKITVKYCPVDALGNLDENNISRFKTFNRWLWTTTVFNDYYYQVKDFNDLQLTLTYDIGVKYETNSKYLYKKINYISPKNDIIQKSEDISGYISAQVQLITDTSKISNTENSGNNTGDGSGNNNSGDISEIWEWNITTYKIYPAISVYYDGEVQWDSTKLHLTTADGTYTYEQNIHYKLVEGPKDILIVLTGILKETKIIVNSEEGFGKAKQSGKVSPPNTLELTVN